VITSPVFRKYFLPGFVFQSVVIAGGYGTGRELAEFFLTYGPLGGLLAMLLVSTVIWSAVCAASFAFSRAFHSYDYRSFFKHLLGRGWFLYEIAYFAQLLLVLAVIAAAAGAILEETFGLPYAVGVIGIMAAVGFLTFRGTVLIEGFLARWSFVLYGLYLLFFGWCFVRFGGDIVANFRAESPGVAWVTGGVRYAAYNLAIIPPILFSIRHIETRREAIIAGLLAGPIAILPGFLFYVSMVSQYPQVLGEAVPANFLLQILGSRAFQLSYQIVLFGTLIETGTGMIHGVNERIAGVYEERQTHMPAYLRPAIALGLLITGAALARFGLIGLIAKGYGTMTWFFLAVFVVPILTIGIWKLVATPKRVPVSQPS
jgi:uncharacterized membrane protein YkvI